MERARPALSVLFLSLNRFSCLSYSSYVLQPADLLGVPPAELLSVQLLSSAWSSKTEHSTLKCDLTIAEERGRISFPGKTTDPSMFCCVRSLHPECKSEMDPQTYLKKQTLFPTRVFGHLKETTKLVWLDPSMDTVSTTSHSGISIVNSTGYRAELSEAQHNTCFHIFISLDWIQHVMAGIEWVSPTEIPCICCALCSVHRSHRAHIVVKNHMLIPETAPLWNILI